MASIKGAVAAAGGATRRDEAAGAGGGNERHQMRRPTRPPHGNLPAAVLLLVAVYCNLAAEALGTPRGGADGDEFTNVVRKVGTILMVRKIQNEWSTFPILSSPSPRGTTCPSGGFGLLPPSGRTYTAAAAARV